MASIKSASRYNSFDSRSSTQSHQSDPLSSIELKPKPKPNQSKTSSRAIIRTTSSNVAKNEQNLSAMVRKFMEKRSKPKPAANRTALVIPADFVVDDLKKAAGKGSNFGGLQRKLFGKGRSENEVKALTEVKSNTRTLGMVLRSERELLSQNKEQEAEIAEIKLILEEKNREEEKLKDLCLKQREELKALKSSILFPNVMNSQLQELLENQGSELKHAKQLIPSLQRQVTSLTGQLQCLAEDLAEVKADKYSVRSGYDAHISSPRTQAYDLEEPFNSLEFSSADHTTPGSPEDMFLEDLNPCLTPYYADAMSKELEAMGYESANDERLWD